MGAVIPFPRWKDRAFVLRHARRMTELRPAKAEGHLQQQLDIQRQTMLRRGVNPVLVEQHVRSLECAIRAELWRLVLVPGGAA
jgi:pyruvate kinase